MNIILNLLCVTLILNSLFTLEDIAFKNQKINTMFPLYRIGFYNVVKTIRYNGNRNLASKVI